MVDNSWCVHDATRVLHLQQEDTGECLVLLGGEVDLEVDAHMLVVGENPEALVLSVVDLARHKLLILIRQHALHRLPDGRAEEVSLELGELVSDLLSMGLALSSDFFVLQADLFGLLLGHGFFDLYAIKKKNNW